MIRTHPLDNRILGGITRKHAHRDGSSHRASRRGAGVHLAKSPRPGSRCSEVFTASTAKDCCRWPKWAAALSEEPSRAGHDPQAPCRDARDDGGDGGPGRASRSIAWTRPRLRTSGPWPSAPGTSSTNGRWRKAGCRTTRARALAADMTFAGILGAGLARMRTGSSNRSGDIDLPRPEGERRS